MQDIASGNSGEATCFDIHIHTGVTEISPEDTIDEIIEKEPERSRRSYRHTGVILEVRNNEKVFHRDDGGHFHGGRSHVCVGYMTVKQQ